jgi:hypothetical protein
MAPGVQNEHIHKKRCKESASEIGKNTAAINKQ